MCVYIYIYIYIYIFIYINPIQDGPFPGCSGIAWGGGVKNVPVFKTYGTHPKMMKFGIVIPHLKKMQKISESRDTSFQFC